MASVGKFEALEAWQSARDLAKEVYATSSMGGFAKDFVLRDQMSGKLGGLMAYLKASGMKRSKYRVDESGTLNLELGTLNLEPGTLNPEPGTRDAQRGFTMPTAIFLVVILAMLGTFIISVTGLQQSSQVLDVQGVRAYQAARAGIEWGAYQVLDPNNNQPGIGGTPNLPICPAPSTNLPMPAGSSLSIFTVTVQCNAALNAPTTEGNRNVGAYRIIANACNQPSGGSCPNPAPASGYVERQLEAVLSKCKDPTAAAPRFACG